MPIPSKSKLLLAAVLAGAAGVWWWARRPEAPARVVLISIDTLRADRLGCYGFEKIRTPNIDRLAAEGVLFENAATTTPLTLPAHASMLTGRTPLEHGVLDNFGYRLDEEETTLAEFLRSAGWSTAAFVGSFVLDSRWGVAQGFDTYYDRFDTPSAADTPLSSHQRPGNEVLEPALQWIDAQPTDAPFFLFLHFFDPHTPYAPPAPFDAIYPDDDRGRYLGEIAFVDSLVGELLEELEERDLFDETLFVLLGDHGEGLGDHGEATHGLFLYDQTMRVPLIVSGPGVPRGQRVRSQVRTIDVMPTIVDFVDGAASPSMDGESLRPLLRDPGAEPRRLAYIESHYARLHFGWAPLRGIRTADVKLIDAPRRELYDLSADPGEEHNVAEERAATVATLLAELEEIEASRPRPEPRVVDVDPETSARLRALGYLTSSTSGSSAPDEHADGALVDPKDRIDVFNAFTQANEAALLGETERAIELLHSVLDVEPGAVVASLLLGNIHLGEGRFDEAEAAFRGVVDHDGANVDAAYGLALAYEGQGELQAAAAGFERCLELDPDQVRAAFQLAEIRLAQGRAADAEALLERVPGERADPSLQLVLADALLAQGKRGEALERLRDAESDAPDDVLVKLSLGNLLMEQGDVAEALARFEKARDLDPRSAEAWNALGGGLARRGRDSEALTAFEKAVQLDPGFAPAHNNLGIALARAGRGADAERAFKKALEHDPGYAEAYNNLGFLYLQVGAVPEAERLFRQALKIDPDYTQARRNLEEALLRRR